MRGEPRRAVKAHRIPEDDTQGQGGIAQGAGNQIEVPRVEGARCTSAREVAAPQDTARAGAAEFHQGVSDREVDAPETAGLDPGPALHESQKVGESGAAQPKVVDADRR